MYDEGFNEYELAQKIRSAHMRGTFVTNMHPRLMARVCYFSGNQFYFITKQGKLIYKDEYSKYAVEGKENSASLDNEIIQNKVNYYLEIRTRDASQLSPGFNYLFQGNDPEKAQHFQKIRSYSPYVVYQVLP
jgi:hypothetical protein